MYTPRSKQLNGWGMKEGPTTSTPRTPINFTKELRQVLQERNLLTAKSRTKICSMLDSNPGSPIGSPNPNAEAGKRRDFRLQAIQEILTSEISYLNQLEILMNYFVRPLKEKAIIEAIKHTALFGQIEMIFNLNSEFRRELEENLENVAPAFLKMAPFFKLYSVYAFDYRKSLLIVQDLFEKNLAFRQFLEKTESRPEVQRKLNSLMIAPIQRVPRYKLLLEQVLLYTSPGDPDFKALKQSIREIESIAMHINACVEEQETTQFLINLQNSLTNRLPNIVKPSRHVVKEGALMKITRTGSGSKRYCVLMSDIFMFCKMLKDRAPHQLVENSLDCCCIYPLKKCKINELLPGHFKLTCQNEGIIFGTQDVQLSRAWVRSLRDAIELHVQQRKTLRKDSSKRTPIRKKELKKFGADYIISPSKKKCDYDSIYRKRCESNSDEESEKESCFSRKRKLPVADEKTAESATLLVSTPKISAPAQFKLPPLTVLVPKMGKRLKPQTPATAVVEDTNFMSGLRSILKSSDEKSATIQCSSGNNQVSGMPITLPRPSLLMRDESFPLIIENKENDTDFGPPLRKQVKFDESLNTSRDYGTFQFNSDLANLNKNSLRERIYNFFANLF